MTDDHRTEPERWLHFLPRWSLLVALTSLSLPILFLGGLGQQATDLLLGQDYVELLQAARNPPMFRFVWSVDALIWLMIGVSLLAFAGVLQRHAPLPATIIAGCGLAQLFGVFGSFLRLNGIYELGSRYLATAASDQGVILEFYLQLQLVIQAANLVGVMLQGVGFILIAVSSFTLRGFPRWLAIWLLLPGILALAQFSLIVLGTGYLFVLNVIGLIGGSIALNLALAVVLWRPRSGLKAAVAGS